MRLLLLFSTVIFLVSCASYFKRKDCESTNWFEYGQNVALEGRRLTGDQFINECYQAEADVAESALDRGFKSGLEKYCQPETVFQIGKNGNFFSDEMCVGQGLNVLHAKHKAGVLEYCQKSNGYSSGAKGKPYNKICPAELETAFLPEFNRGRKRFLQVNLSENQKSISRLDQEIRTLQNELRFKSSELSRYQYMKTKEDEKLQMLNELNREVQNLERSVRAKQNEKNNLEAKNKDIQLELVRLEN